MTSESPPPPKVLLFDIGGVCVVSPFQAILDYELAHGIPEGYINHTIARTSPSGAWQRAERGEIALDDAFFSLWAAELNDPQAWSWYHGKIGRAPKPLPGGGGIRAKELFFSMMRNSRRPDPHMWPAVRRLRESGRFVVAALSNTIDFPPGLRDDRGALFDPGLRYDPGDPYVERAAGAELARRRDLRNMFDVFVSSAHVGLRKPHPDAYRFALDEVESFVKGKGRAWWEEGQRMPRADVLFVDDIGENLKAARGLGLRTLKVNLGRNVDAVKELERVTGMQLLDGRAKL